MFWEDISIVGLDVFHKDNRINKKNPDILLLCADPKDPLILVVIRLRSAVSPACYLSYFVFFFLCWRTSCWCWSRRFMCSVDFSDAGIVDGPSEEAIVRTGSVT